MKIEKNHIKKLIRIIGMLKIKTKNTFHALLEISTRALQFKALSTKYLEQLEDVVAKHDVLFLYNTDKATYRTLSLLLKLVPTSKQMALLRHISESRQDSNKVLFLRLSGTLVKGNQNHELIRQIINLIKLYFNNIIGSRPELIKEESLKLLRKILPDEYICLHNRIVLYGEKTKSLQAIECIAKFNPVKSLKLIRTTSFITEYLKILSTLPVCNELAEYIQGVFTNILKNTNDKNVKYTSRLLAQNTPLELVKYAQEYPELAVRVCSIIVKSRKDLDCLKITYMNEMQEPEFANIKLLYSSINNFQEREYIRRMVEDKTLFLIMADSIIKKEIKVVKYLRSITALFAQHQLVELAEIALCKNSLKSLSLLLPYANHKLVCDKMMDQLDQEDEMVCNILSQINIPEEQTGILFSHICQKVLESPKLENIKLLTKLVKQVETLKIPSILSLVYKLVNRWIPDKNLVSKIIQNLVKEISTKIGVNEIIGILPFNSKNKPFRRNISRICKMFMKTDSCMLVPILLLDFKRDDCKAMILKILAITKYCEFVLAICPMLISGMTSPKTNIRRLGFRAAANIIKVSKNKEITLHLLNLGWYFILDTSVENEFNKFIANVVAVIGPDRIKQYSELGQIHPSKQVRKRYLMLTNYLTSLHEKANIQTFTNPSN